MASSATPRPTDPTLSSAAPQPSRGSARGRPRGHGGRRRGSGRGRHRGGGGGPYQERTQQNWRPNPEPYDSNLAPSSTATPSTDHPTIAPKPRPRHNRRKKPSPSVPDDENNNLNPSLFLQSTIKPSPPNSLKSPSSAVANASTAELTELSAKLSNLLLRGAVECSICLEKVRRESAKWSCSTCFTVTHLHCARKWASRKDNDTTTPSAAQQQQGCPSCRASIKESTLQNSCFCGRRKPLPVEPGVTPGSCGEPCLKKRGAPGSSCPHRCVAICHPGPCLSCLATRPPAPCFCGKTKVSLPCGEASRSASCGDICNSMLPCGHRCERICHEGDCGECTVTLPLNCHCGKVENQLPCGVPAFSCGNVCGKTLSCRKHKCKLVCHEGPCPECIFSPLKWTTCACGKQQLTSEQLSIRFSCTDKIPSCGASCGRDLGCIAGHKCKKPCGHSGDCGKCKATVSAECRCGFTVMQVACGASIESLKEQLVCERKCNDRLLCRQHTCQIICCPYKKRKVLPRPNVVPSNAVWVEEGQENLSNAERRRTGHCCEKVCSKPLSCGKHSCDLTCGHQGPCPPCGILQREPIYCACGTESIPGPVRCGTPPPECRKNCSSADRNCEHSCLDKCHFGPCPPCVQTTKFECAGGHGEFRFLPCHIGAKGIRCHRACGRSLKCGVHACRKPCHANYPANCEESSESGCTQVCGLPRKACEHSCLSACHPGMMCPDVPCKTVIQVKCPCGRREDTAMCLWSSQSCGGGYTAMSLRSSRPSAGFSSTMSATKEDGHDSSIRLSCDEECETQSRLRGFASIVGKEIMTDGTVINVTKEENGDGLGTATVNSVKYSEFLLRFAENEPKMLAYFEKSLASIVNGRVKKVTLEDLPQLHRLVLHTLSDMYLLDHESSGSAPNRRIVIRHQGAGTKPRFPVPLLSEAYAQKQQIIRNSRLAQNRSIVVYIPNAPNMPTTLTDRVHQVLKTHSGFYRFVGPAKIALPDQARPSAYGYVVENIDGKEMLPGLCVEFTTLERAKEALGLFNSISGTVAKMGYAQTGGNSAANGRSNVQQYSKPTSNKSASAQEWTEVSGPNTDSQTLWSTSWDDSNHGENTETRPSLTRGIRQSFAELAHQDDDNDVPESWDD